MVPRLILCPGSGLGWQGHWWSSLVGQETTPADPRTRDKVSNLCVTHFIILATCDTHELRKHMNFALVAVVYKYFVRTRGYLGGDGRNVTQERPDLWSSRS